jgi:hypothetical protein
MKAGLRIAERQNASPMENNEKCDDDMCKLNIVYTHMLKLHMRTELTLQMNVFNNIIS